jgi:KDO2-lipid IV(A) lauroyltransferase
MAVVAPISNPLADRMLTRLRRLTGQEVTPREGAFKTLVRTLRDGGYVGLMMDQNTVPARGGEFVKFFGLPVPMSRAAAALEEKTAATVVFIFCLPDGRGNYTVRALRPGPAGHGRTTQALAEAMEDVIRRDPGQWMWTYKRWKYIPPGASRDGFPFYARGMKEEEQRRPGTALAAMGNGAC